MPSTDPCVPTLTPTHLAYVIYTSGSTGKPKGVMVEHRNAYNYLAYIKDRYPLTQEDRVLQFSSLSFDAAFEEIFAALAQGGTCVLRPMAASAGMEGLRAACEQHEITVVEMPTAYWHVAMADIAAGRSIWPASVRLVVIGGEPASSMGSDTWQHHIASRSVLVNSYGPTEATIGSTAFHSSGETTANVALSIGRPIANVRMYILDAHGEPVPVGVPGEMYIAGAGIARGYLNREALTAERFVNHSFGASKERLYRTGDVGRWLAGGAIEYIGRIDFQVKIRGFRIELGEIETRLAAHAKVRDAVVIAREDIPGDQRLVAYVAARTDTPIDVPELRSHLAQHLPDYMLPAAFVQLNALPLTPNGKLDRKALPAPDADALAHRTYEAPREGHEEVIANIWSTLLGVDGIGRHDHFFELGGHSLLAVRVIEHLRASGVTTSVKALFEQPTVAGLAATLKAPGSGSKSDVPLNLIDRSCRYITPDMLPLITLSQADIDHIVRQIPGGVSNIQDIYALSPLQDGMLFHHLMSTDGDPYLLVNQITFANRQVLGRFLDAVQRVVDRHDILRSAFIWEGLSEPAQVVCRKAPLSVTELLLDQRANAGTASEQLARRFNARHTRIDLTEAPQLRFVIAQEPNSQGWVLVCMQHHLAGDHSTMETLFGEVAAILSGRDDTLSVPPPFRNLVAQTRMNGEAHEAFFRKMLAEIDEPTLPFGLTNVHRDGQGIAEVYRRLPQHLNDNLRRQARRFGVSLASLCHLAYGQVLAQCSGREAVVFGTVLLGRMHGSEGADRAIGPFINTLPLRMDLDHTPVERSVRQVHRQLADLVQHEHASLALAQRCSGIAAPTPLFTALLNYRHNYRPDATATAPALVGISMGRGQERTNYPFTVSVEDDGQSLGLTPQVMESISPDRVCDLMQSALEHLAQALDRTPTMPVRQLRVIPASERELLLHTWNQTESISPEDFYIHVRFEERAAKTPDAIALVQDNIRLTYAQLNAQANRLAHRLIAMGVQPDSRVALCVDRRPHMIISLLAILKAGGAYVPMDPAYPLQRLRNMLDDAEPTLLLVDAAGREAFGNHVPNTLSCVSVDEPLSDSPETNPDPIALGLLSSHLAYVIYTSGSTGKPKGVMVEHAQLCRLINVAQDEFAFGPDDVWTLFHSIAFDFSVWEVWGALAYGGRLVIVPYACSRSPKEFLQLIRREKVTVLNQTPSAFRSLAPVAMTEAGEDQLRIVIFGGEMLDVSSLASWVNYRGLERTRLVNMYGITEITVHATLRELHKDDIERVQGNGIGAPLRDLRAYVLNIHGEPAPIGVTGELYIGGAGVARGYLHRPELTAERFLSDPFVADSTARMYRTGDLACRRSDGTLDYMGRNDHQVKIRGFRIELGEIEARLMNHTSVRDAVVIAREDVPGDQRLVAYVTTESACQIEAGILREHLIQQLPDHMLPAAFVQMDALPLTTNGKLDRNALPAPDANALANRPYEVPQGDIEQCLASIWSELLGVARVGRHDHFFALGGHSLMAIRVVARFQQQAHVELALRDIFAHPVLTDLAARVQRGDLYRNVVLIRKGGNALPLFLVHPAGGEIGYVRLMAEALQPGYPIYGIAASGLKEGQAVPKTIEAMAASYLAELRCVQHSGPYRLGGWSMGGTIAFEMAHQLMAIGETVEFLGLLDTSFQPTSPQGSHYDEGIVRFALQIIPSHASIEQRGAFTALADENNLEEMYRYACEQKWIENDVPAEAYIRHLNVRYAEANAASQYTPQSGGFPLVHFCAAESSVPLAERWKEELSNSLTVVPVPGDHLSMMTAPHIYTLCELFDDALVKNAESLSP
jgi:amino acid adenylation domain-containing protein